MKVAIIGTGMTKFSEHWDKNLSDLAFEAGIQAITEAGISSKDLDSMFIGNMSTDEQKGYSKIWLDKCLGGVCI